MTAPPRDPPAPDLPGALWRDDRFAYLSTTRAAAIDAAGVPRVWVGGRWADVSGTPWAEAVYCTAWMAERTRAHATEAALRATTSAHDATLFAPASMTTSDSGAAPAPPSWRGDVRYLGPVDGRWSLLAWSDVLGRHVAREWSAADQWWRLAGEHRREAIYDAAFSHERAQVVQLTSKCDETAQRLAQAEASLAAARAGAVDVVKAAYEAEGTCPACGGERYPDSRRGADE